MSELTAIILVAACVLLIISAFFVLNDAGNGKD